MNVRADREIPVVLSVAKGSLINKAILVPSALVISAIAPMLIQPLLMIGGAYLCFEGVEKVIHTIQLLRQRKQLQKDLATVPAAEKLLKEDIKQLHEQEGQKIKGAIRTDFILSAEIIVISLGSISSAAFSVQVMSLIIIALLMTAGVYGLVAIIVKLDDLGLLLFNKKGISKKIGIALIHFAPQLMKFLSIAGTIAMFLVGGSIVQHGLHVSEVFDNSVLKLVQNLFTGFLVGAVVLSVIQFTKVFKRSN
jgi:predicted DNA repair protein MutK